MATTQEFYRLGSRLPRYTTKLNTFASGMYLTNHTIPEGFTKTMVNYDIDDTGSCCKPRRGRVKQQVLNYNSETLGPVSFTDYIYAYNKDNTEVEDIKDLVLSYGLYTKLTALVNVDYPYQNPIYVAYMDKVVDNNVYVQNEEGDYVVQTPGTIVESSIKDFWALYYNKETAQFEKVLNKDIGYVTARTIKNAYAFDKAFKDVVGKPIGTVLNNEPIVFAGGKLKYKQYPANPDRNELNNFSTPVLTKLIITHEPEGYTIKRKPLTARVLNPLEASSTGYNILSQTPYVFEDERGGAISILGMLLYDSQDNTVPIFSARLGQAVTLRAYYQYPTPGATLKYKVEILDTTRTDSSWVVLEDFTKTVVAGEPIKYDLVPKYNSFLVRITLRNGDDTATEYPAFREIVCGGSAYDNLVNKTFDLSTCKGMLNWLGCVGVYGVANAPDTIFFSDVDDPSYFPFPNNIMTFDNEILAVHNYLDHLIVVTVDSIWLVTAGTTINTSIQKRILANIHVPEIDAINLVVLKDQIFFKTDTEFYVLKPNQYTSDATDLKNYVNSTAIANYNTNFTVETTSILNKVYPMIWQAATKEARKQIRFEDFDVIDTRSVVKDAEVHYIYTIKPILTDNKVCDKLDLHLIYNTLTRSWRLYLLPIGADNVYYAPVLYRNKQSGAYSEFFPYTKADGTSAIVITKSTYDVVSDDITDGDWHLTNTYNNFPYLDTGTIAIDDMTTKRFRELQFSLMNKEKSSISFFADFILDGQERVQATNYIIQHITDPNDPEYGKIYVTPVEDTNVELAGLTATDHWVIDFSKFPDLNVTNVRFELRGRGRRAALQLLNTSLQRFELSELLWVYRTMNVR